MKKFLYVALFAFVAFAPVLFSSCDDDHWYDNNSWRRSWYGRNGGNNNNNNNGGSTIEDEGACLLGTWVGEMIYMYPNADGSTGKARFNAEMVFQMNKNNSYTEGVGTEIDRAGEQTQTLSFTWYIDKSGNIYVRYTDTGKTFMLDILSSSKGFYLDNSKFNGFMVAQKDVEEIEFNFTRSGNNNSRRAPAKYTFKTDLTDVPYQLVRR